MTLNAVMPTLHDDRAPLTDAACAKVDVNPLFASSSNEGWDDYYSAYSLDDFRERKKDKK